MFKMLTIVKYQEEEHFGTWKSSLKPETPDTAEAVEVSLRTFGGLVRY